MESSNHQLLSAYEQFVWKIKFSELIGFNPHAEHVFTIRDCYHRLLEVDVEVDPVEKLIRIVPKSIYQRNQYYYLHLYYEGQPKPFYIGFIINGYGLKTVKFKNDRQYIAFIQKEREIWEKNSEELPAWTVELRDWSPLRQVTDPLAEVTFRVPKWPLLGILLGLPFVYFGGFWLKLGITCMVISLVVFLMLRQEYPSKKLRRMTLLYNKGVNYYNAGDIEQALEYFCEAEKVHLKSPVLTRTLWRVRREL